MQLEVSINVINRRRHLEYFHPLQARNLQLPQASQSQTQQQLTIDADVLLIPSHFLPIFINPARREKEEKEKKKRKKKGKKATKAGRELNACRAIQYSTGPHRVQRQSRKEASTDN